MIFLAFMENSLAKSDLRLSIATRSNQKSLSTTQHVFQVQFIYLNGI